MRPPPLLFLEDVPGGPEAGTFITAINELPAHGGKDILFEEGRFRVSIFVQLLNGMVHVYENRCPHAGTPLNLLGDRFMNLDNSHLICRTHGALFDPETGVCRQGPCKGQYLRPVAFEIREKNIYTRGPDSRP